MNDKAVEERIITLTNEVFVESFELEPSELAPDKTLFADLGLDSLDTVDLVVAIQKKFNVKIRDDQRVREIRTLGDVYKFIMEVNRERDEEGSR
jgi:acyl carrier protein